MKLDITVPSDYVGDVIGGLAGVRGQMLGQDQAGKNIVVHAEAPQSELFDYAIKLRAMTQARGSFTLEFSRYDVLQPNLADKVIADYKKSQEEK